MSRWHVHGKIELLESRHTIIDFTLSVFADDEKQARAAVHPLLAARPHLVTEIALADPTTPTERDEGTDAYLRGMAAAWGDDPDYVPGDRLVSRALSIVDRLVTAAREQLGPDLEGGSIEDLLLDNVPELSSLRARELADEYRRAHGLPERRNYRRAHGLPEGRAAR